MKLIKTSLFLFIGFFSLYMCLGSSAALSQMSNDEIYNELKAMKERINKLEKDLTKKDQEIKDLRSETMKKKETIAGVESEEEQPPLQEIFSKWSDKIEISGLIEVEYNHDTHNRKHRTTERDEDITLSTLEIDIGAQVNKYVRGDIVLLYEEDETEDFTVDEGTITIGGIEETFGLYLKGGKYYPHFGELNSYFINDPLTQEIFEIQESGLEIGYDSDWFSVGAGVFNGDIEKEGDHENNVDDFYADACFHNPEDTLGGLSLLAGVSYLTNVGDTDTLSDEDALDDKEIRHNVEGVAAYLVSEYGPFSFSAEYITALDDFKAGEMEYAYDRNGTAKKSEPAALNLEFAFRPVEVVQVAVKYEETDDMFSLYPEKQYGLGVSWEAFKFTTLSAEYLHGDYDSNNKDREDERDLISLQMAIEF